MTSFKRKLSLALPTLASALLLLTPAATTAAEAATPHHTTRATATAPASVGDICHSDLPSQADDTLDLIAQGGPYPYPEDGEVFQNREGVLPSEPNGYYHEYTVVTPGSSDRGARRIVTGEAQNEDYYTSDHYETFDLIDFDC